VCRRWEAHCFIGAYQYPILDACNNKQSLRLPYRMCLKRIDCSDCLDKGPSAFVSTVLHRHLAAMPKLTNLSLWTPSLAHLASAAAALSSATRWTYLDLTCLDNGDEDAAIDLTHSDALQLRHLRHLQLYLSGPAASALDLINRFANLSSIGSWRP
jgi:hypothetical protein